MDVLFHDVRLNYFVPIISQQGEVAGKLQVPHAFIFLGVSYKQKQNIAIQVTGDYIYPRWN